MNKLIFHSLSYFLVGLFTTMQLSAQSLSISTVDHNLITCFPATAVDSSGKPYTCEASAVLYADKKMYIGSDRDFPGASALFTLPFSLPLANYGADVKVVDQPLINACRKWEDMSLSPDGRLVFAMTGFDRVKKGSHDWDVFNMLVYWPAGMEDSAQLLAETDSGGIKSSLMLRHRISRVLADQDFPDGMPYFKTEALCALPGNRLIFGIREYGSDYDHFTYAFRLLECSYRKSGNQLELNDDLREICRLDSLRAYGNKNPLAISSMEYDPLTDRIWVLTSYEDNSGPAAVTGAYLWVWTPEALEKCEAPRAVRDPRGLHQHFTHKAEGITLISPSTLLVICDDDRNLLPLENQTDIIRQTHQSAYYILQIE